MIYRPIGSRIRSKSEIASRYRSEYRSSLQASEKVPNFRQKKGLCLRYRKGYQKCYSASRCPWVAFLISTFSDQYRLRFCSVLSVLVDLSVDWHCC